MVSVKRSKFLLDQDRMENDYEVDIANIESDNTDETESEEEDMPVSKPSKTAIYNKDGLLEKLEDIAWPDNTPWIQKLSVDFNQEQEIDVNDDLSRELSFYTQALEGTKQAFEKLQSLGAPFLRPADYYAEMVKSDTHMVKIKGRLLEEKKKIEEAEERRKAREAKKISKEVQAQKLKDRAKQKKHDIESVKKWRKQRQQSGFAVGKDENMDFSFEEGKGFERSKKRRPGVSPGDRSGGKGKRGIDKNRKNRDSKFGFGGRKGLKKQNTSDSTNEARVINKGDFHGNKKRKR